MLVIPAALLVRSYLPLLHRRPYPLRVTELCHLSCRAMAQKRSLYETCLVPRLKTDHF